MKKIAVHFLVVLLLFSLVSCASDEDKKIAKDMMEKIDNIGTITLDSAEKIYELNITYTNFSDKQKRLVRNSDLLLEYVEQLEELILEENIKNDPTNKITKQDMAGIWEMSNGSFYFSESGNVYWMGGKSKRSQSDFTSKYLVASSYRIGEYNRVTKVKEGEIYSSVTNELIEFTVIKDSNGNMTLNVLNSPAEGTYKKTGQAVTAPDVDPQQCWHTGCTNTAAKTGDTVYCEEHSNKCIGCNCYIDEDALLCLDCIANALGSP